MVTGSEGRLRGKKGVGRRRRGDEGRRKKKEGEGKREGEGGRKEGGRERIATWIRQLLTSLVLSMFYAACTSLLVKHTS